MWSKRRLNITFLVLLLLLSVAFTLAKNGGDNSGSGNDHDDDNNQGGGDDDDNNNQGGGDDDDEDGGHNHESEAASSNRSLWVAHGALAATAWGILVPLAIGSSLIRKILESIGLPKGFWFQLHRGLNALAAILTIAAFSIAVYIFNKEGEDEHFTEETHHTLGLVIFILTLLQALNGFLRPHLPHTEEHVVNKGDDEVAEQEEEQEDENQNNAMEDEPAHVVVVAAPKSTARIIWEFGHRILGVSLLAMSWWQVQSGFGLFVDEFEGATNLSPVFFGVAGGICAVALVLFVVQTVMMKEP
ncbi:putative catecholamine binding [Fragilaria crotonensis]|nr:putative catecholamine binding [Fragilaria crotonensis]